MHAFRMLLCRCGEIDADETTHKSGSTDTISIKKARAKNFSSVSPAGWVVGGSRGSAAKVTRLAPLFFHWGT